MSALRRIKRPFLSLALPWICTLCLFLVPMQANGETPKVVVIPMGSKSASQAKELYLPALAFRPLDAMAGGTWQEGGSMLKPIGASEWIAPLPLPTGTKITTIELIWKNIIYQAGTSRITLRLASDTTGASLDLFNMTSTEANSGVYTVQRTIDFTFSDPYHPIVSVGLSSSNRWLIGVKVSYTE